MGKTIIVRPVRGAREIISGFNPERHPQVDKHGKEVKLSEAAKLGRRLGEALKAANAEAKKSAKKPGVLDGLLVSKGGLVLGKVSEGKQKEPEKTSGLGSFGVPLPVKQDWYKEPTLTQPSKLDQIAASGKTIKIGRVGFGDRVKKSASASRPSEARPHFLLPHARRMYEILLQAIVICGGSGFMSPRNALSQGLHYVHRDSKWTRAHDDLLDWMYGTLGDRTSVTGWLRMNHPEVYAELANRKDGLQAYRTEWLRQFVKALEEMHPGKLG